MISSLYYSGQEDVTWLMDLLKKWIHPNNYLGNLMDYTVYLLGVLLMPFIILLSPVLFILGCIYLSNLLLHIYKIKINLKGDYLTKSWDAGRRAVSYIWDIYGTVWHGIKLFYKINGLTHDGRVECVEILKKGYLLGVLPGGSREALFSDENYSLLWGSRKGFAHVARDAKVPIIPIFTKNLREGYRTLGKIWPFKWLYERTRWPIVPVYGGFPVKFCSYVGDPIPYDPNITVEELAEKTKTAIEDLRDKHQKIPVTGGQHCSSAHSSLAYQVQFYLHKESDFSDPCPGNFPFGLLQCIVCGTTFENSPETLAGTQFQLIFCIIIFTGSQSVSGPKSKCCFVYL
ncbi:monoacylglycerol/Diacylglycerol O-acyltransferase-like isoform X2 [Rhineura floridana]|uniref:monoacylglycerol/Diacylglycerol O-acyltransferase-like isoform X2 n=1 Tax=Rhineura floridana TaxID=261503 RepID=UPI002AC80D1C|nr:monoacylglycerol/Diacylglycerol O-acyltransferase-like isoform X2 [Rhineura floridana]